MNAAPTVPDSRPAGPQRTGRLDTGPDAKPHAGPDDDAGPGPNKAPGIAPTTRPGRAGRRPLRRGLRTYLVALVVVSLLPAIGIAVFAIRESANSYREGSAARLRDTVRTLAHAVHGDLANRAMLLRTLAASPADQPGSMSWQMWLDRIGPTLNARIDVRDVPSAADAGSAAVGTHDSDIPGDVIRRALTSGEPTLSNLYLTGSPAVPRIALSLAAPSTRGVPRVLSLVMAPEQLVRLEPSRDAAHEALLLAVTDGTGRILARSRNADRYVGTRAPDWDKLVALHLPQGLFEARTTEGADVMFAFETLPGTPGWVMVVGEPLAQFNAEWHRLLRQMAIAGSIALLVALMLAAWLSRAILRPVQALARRAQAVSEHDGEDVPGPPDTRESAPIRELESLRDSIRASEAALRRRADAVSVNERRYRTLAQSGALVLWRADPSGRVLAATGWRTLTGQPDTQALQRLWTNRVHPDDRAATIEAMKASAESLHVDAEFRVGTADDDWRWVRARGALVVDADRDINEWVGVLEDVDERRRAQARVHHLAHHDELTGLPNRTRLREQLQAAIARARRGQSGALLYIDLDRFKLVNDTLGHPTGDALLVAATTRLEHAMDPADCAARLGGDEFAVVQARTERPDDAARLASRLIDALGAPYEVNGHQVQIGASVGIMPITGDEADPDVVLKHADLALYRAKQQGRGRHCFFDPHMNALMQTRREQELQLRGALERDEFELLYESQIDARTRQIQGFEAVLRWCRPGHAPVALGQFSGLLEELGLSSAVGRWMLARACRDAAGWPAPVRVAIDLLPAQLREPGLLAAVGDALQASRLAADRLELEIDERILLEDPPQRFPTLARLRAIGVRIVLDHFAGERSSLASLSGLRFDRLKLAASAIQGAGRGDDALVAAVLHLCAELGIPVGADGVDDAGHLDRLDAHRVHAPAGVQIQGALFGSHLSADEAASLCRVTGQVSAHWRSRLW